MTAVPTDDELGLLSGWPVPPAQSAAFGSRDEFNVARAGSVLEVHPAASTLIEAYGPSLPVGNLGSASESMTFGSPGGLCVAHGL